MGFSPFVDHGWPDLALWQHGAAREGVQRVHRFIGNAHKEIASNHVTYGGPEVTNYSKPRSTPCDVPSDFLAMLGNDLECKKYLRHMKSCLEEEEKHQSSKENFRVWWFDLNQFNRHRSKQGLVVQPLHPCPVRNDGEMFLYIRAGETWRPILLTTGDSLMADRPLDPWCPVSTGRARRANSAHGWPDLIIGQNISATERRMCAFGLMGTLTKTSSDIERSTETASLY